MLKSWHYWEIVKTFRRESWWGTEVPGVCSILSLSVFWWLWEKSFAISCSTPQCSTVLQVQSNRIIQPRTLGAKINPTPELLGMLCNPSIQESEAADLLRPGGRPVFWWGSRCYSILYRTLVWFGLVFLERRDLQAAFDFCWCVASEAGALCFLLCI